MQIGLKYFVKFGFIMQLNFCNNFITEALEIVHEILLVRDYYLGHSVHAKKISEKNRLFYHLVCCVICC